MVVLQGGRQFVSRPRIERIAQQYMGRNMQIEFDVRDSIPLTRTGKRRVIVSHLNATAA